MSFAPAPSLDAPRMFDQPSDTPPIASKKPVVLQWADVLLAGMLIVFTLPLAALVGLAIKIDSPGPILTKELRLGRNGRRYSTLAFRTTSGDARSAPRSNWIGREQPTKVGHFLQYSRIEELPKLLNVLRGEMTLIGAPGKPHAFDD